MDVVEGLVRLKVPVGREVVRQEEVELGVELLDQLDRLRTKRSGLFPERLEKIREGTVENVLLFRREPFLLVLALPLLCPLLPHLHLLLGPRHPQPLCLLLPIGTNCFGRELQGGNQVQPL